MSGSMRRWFRRALPAFVVPCVLAVALVESGCFKLDQSDKPAPLSQIRSTRAVTSFEAVHETYTDFHLPGMLSDPPPQTQKIHTFYRNGAWRDEISKGSAMGAVNIRTRDEATNWIAGQQEARRIRFPAGTVRSGLKLPPYADGSLSDLIPPPFTVSDAKLVGEATIAGRPA